MLQEIRSIHCIFIIAGLLILTAACRKHAGSDTGGTGKVQDVYVLGKVADSVVCWKNGVPRNIYSQARIQYDFGSSALYVSGNDVYIAGIKPNNNPTVRGGVPVYWRNDAAIVLPDSTGDAGANSIFVSNNDVYAAGYMYLSKDTPYVPYTTPEANYPRVGNVATVWKNGVPITLPGHFYVGLAGAGNQYVVRVYSDYVSALFVSGNDVYVAGGTHFSEYGAMYWKNGAPTDLTKGLIYQDRNGRLCYPTTTAVYVSDNDVYVAGYQLASTGNYRALYWKNGAVAYLTNDSLSNSVANCVFVSGNDVYIAGYQNINNYSRAIIWKNGVPTRLTMGSTSSIANAIFVAGDDVYVAGYQWTAFQTSFIATYWKNGEVVKLTDGTIGATANSIYVQ